MKLYEQDVREEAMSRDRPQNKHLRPNPEALGVMPLAPGEMSFTVRVRGSSEFRDWVRGIGVFEVSRVLHASMLGPDAPKPVLKEKVEQAGLFDEIPVYDPEDLIV